MIRRAAGSSPYRDADEDYTDDSDYDDDFDYGGGEDGDIPETEDGTGFMEEPTEAILDKWEAEPLTAEILRNFQSEEHVGQDVLGFRDVYKLLEVLGMDKQAFLGLFPRDDEEIEPIFYDYFDDEEAPYLDNEADDDYAGPSKPRRGGRPR